MKILTEIRKLNLEDEQKTDLSHLKLKDFDRDGLILLIQRIDNEMMQTRESLKIALLRLDIINLAVDESEEELRKNYAQQLKQYGK